MKILFLSGIYKYMYILIVNKRTAFGDVLYMYIARIKPSMKIPYPPHTNY